jgi:sporulation protein YlmC with PRC-barrel domain
MMEATMIDTMMRSSHNLIASDRVEGTPVRRSNGGKIGTIQRLMIDKRSGKVAYAVLSFGGFLGLGQQHLAVPWESLSYHPGLDAYRLELSDAEFERAPSVSSDPDFDWGERNRVVEMPSFNRAPYHWGAY